jgi:sorbitol-specific phosphotransferase system component IIA
MTRKSLGERKMSLVHARCGNVKQHENLSEYGHLSIRLDGSTECANAASLQLSPGILLNSISRIHRGLREEVP